MKGECHLFSVKMPKGFSKVVHALVLLLSFFGALMVTSAGMNHNASWDMIAFSFIRQVIFIVIGYVLMVYAARFGRLSFLKRYIFPLAIFTTIILLVPLMFPARGGAQAWISIPFIGMTVQPSEFAKVVVILLFAIYMGDVNTDKKGVFDIIKIPAVFTLIYTFIVVVLQSDLGTGVILFALGWFLFLIPSIPSLRTTKIVFSLITIALFAFVFWILTPSGLEFVNRLPLSTYQLNRFNDMANPFINRYESSFQLFNSLIAFVKGNWWGIGLGKSVQKLGYLPVADSDYILAIIVEEIGILGFVIIFVGYLTLLFALLAKSMKVRTEKGKMIVFGAALYLMLHFILNVGGVTAIIPLTGVPLLMISSGGSSQLAIMMAIGIAQGVIARECHKGKQSV